MDDLQFFNPYSEIRHSRPWTAATEQDYHKRFSGAIERWLDAGYGSCLLRNPACAAAVSETIHYFDEQRLLVSSVVMQNHAHALFIQNPAFLLKKILSSWKAFSTRTINKLLGRSGTLWQRDYFDRLVRDEQHFRNCVRYVRRNPEKARLVKREYVLYENELAKAIE
jgi:putative transposase